MVLIAAVAFAFVPIRLFLWENWHFPEEWSVPEIGLAGLEINVSLVPLALSLSAAVLLLGMKTAIEHIGTVQEPALRLVPCFDTPSAMGYAGLASAMGSGRS